jgi:YggT family protein
MRSILILLLNLATIVFIVRALLSWFPIGHDSPARPVVDLLHRITEPVLGPIRRVLPPMGGLDLSVFLVILIIQIVLRPLVVSVF